MERKFDLIPLLDFIDPAGCDYGQWVAVGMALREEGYPASVWDAWSARDPRRYHPHECEKKWNTFAGNSSPVTGGTIVQMAKNAGWQPDSGGRELDWNDEIQQDDLQILKPAWVEDTEIQFPKDWDPVQQLTLYLETLFEAGENVGYVTDSYQREDGKYLPTKGCWDRTAGELIEALSHCGGDIGAVIGDYKPEAGAWIRFNPLDGQGCKNENVTDFRYALVECDNMELPRQNALIRELELPVAALVYSGGKSLHAIVRVDAGSYSEYRQRVDYLYQVCQKNGLQLDRQNCNPSRLSRMPGVTRDGQKQCILATNLGKVDWVTWKEWVESVNDDLPEFETMADSWANLPELSPALIEGVLRQGHKMLLSGPSKAGKSFALIELSIALAEGRSWLGFPCAKGRVLYVNLELDRASCLHRYKDVYEALGWQPKEIRNIDIWNLRGKSVPMDKLAPKLIRRAAKKHYIAVIIDPIYKVITGDENSADQMAAFCNQFDKVCTELGCAVIYCHHHSKGAQGGKRSMDRASGSGVFARDPDALLDLIELPLSDAIKKQERQKAAAAVCSKAISRHDLEDEVSQDDLCSGSAMLDACRKLLPEEFPAIQAEASAAEKAADSRTAWRLSATLREFPPFKDLNLWFDYPVHKSDASGSLADVCPEEEKPSWQRAIEKRKPKNDRQKDRKVSVETAFDACMIDGSVSTESLAEYMGVSEKTARRRVQEHGGFWIEDGKIGKKAAASS